MAHDVFISYSSKDKTTADAVCARLEARGIRCWIAPRDVRYGANYGAAIMDAIHGSKVMVLVLSSHANASRHIPNEIERAVSHGLAVVPFRIEDVAPAKSLDLFIGSRHWLDAWTPPLEAHLDRLAESLGSLISEDPSPVPEPAPRRSPPPDPMPPRLPQATISPLVAGGAGAVLVVVALLAWLAFGRSGGTGGVPPAGAAVTPPSVPRAAGGAATDIVGCWRWGNNATVVIRPDGTMTAAPFDGTWQLVGNRSYVFTWPEPVDTLTMAPDRRTMGGSNQYGVPVLATRISGGPDVSGAWSWDGVATVTIDRAGSVALGSTLKGRWTGDANQAHIRVTWEKVRDSVTLSDDASHLQGGNQYGAPVSGSRLASCQ